MSQIIPLEKAIIFARKPFSEVSDYLTNAGWDYFGRDASDTNKNELKYIWSYDYNKESKVSTNLLYTSKEVHSDTVFNFEEGISKEFYINALKTLPTMGFKEENTFPQADLIEKIFWRRSTLVELMSSIYTTKDGNRQNGYYLIVSRVIAD